MAPHTLNPQSIRSLKRLVGARADQLVWDLNAVYVVGPTSTTKIEATSVTPASPEPHPYDEIFPIAVTVSQEAPTFHREGEVGFAYRVLAENVYVTAIEVVRVAVVFPEETEVSASLITLGTQGSNVVDCGVFIHTPVGVLAAFQRHPGFGFGSKAPIKLLESAAAKALLPSAYELVQIENAP